jgi:pyruvate dehydrogenase E2 component (dihydrolipoamide acetyltransferase)
MDFKLPDIGEGVHEGEITKWLVQPGDKIEADQPMVEVMTDKATVEIPSPVAGTVSEVMVKEGETIEVGKVIIRIAENGKGAPKAEVAQTATRPEASETPRSAPTNGNGGRNLEAEDVQEIQRPAAAKSAPAPRNVSPSATTTDHVIPFDILATPATRKLARDLSVDLREVKGTGNSGRITKEDVQMAYEGHQAATTRSSHPAPTAERSNVPAVPSATKVSTVSRGAIERIPLRGIRKKISEAMSHSKHTAAHFTYVEEVDMTEVVKLRKASLDEAAKLNIKLTFLPFIMKALVPALKEFPFLNSSLDDEKQEIILKGDYNFGVATDTPNGLMVPVVKAVDSKSIWELAREIHDLSERARTGKAAIDDLRGGTFTVTNAGSIGGVFTAPVINHPEVAILGVNAIRKRPMVKDDQIVIRDMMYLSMSVDHRVVDGADAARFMNRLIYFLSEPTRLVFA